jgi:YYY domain-containing protein
VGTSFALLLGNIAGGIQLLQNPNRLATYDWWAPSRVIDGTANEFPYFSFLLADLHAHVLVTPFTLVIIAYALQVALHGPPAYGDGRPARRPWSELALAGLVLGVLYPTNSFDLPTALAVGAGALVIWTLESEGRVGWAIGWGFRLAAASVALYLPFWLGFSPPADGVAIVRERVPFTEFARDYAFIYGLSLWVLLALFASRLRRVPVRCLVWAGSAAFFLLVLLAPASLAGLAVMLVIAAGAVYMTFETGPAAQAERFLWLLAAVALLLVASGEIVYVRDVFEGTESFRFNTVFKTGYQAWFLLAIVAAVGSFWSARWLGRRVRVVWLSGLGVLVALALAYPVAASYSRSGTFAADPTLDGLAWMRRASSDDVAGIEWLRANAPDDSVVLETVGNDFDPDGRGRVSTFTGLATVLGWAGHEVQWGHEPSSRAGDVETMYRTTDVSRARSLLDTYGVDYAFVGSLERKDHPTEGLGKFAELGTEVFRSGGTVIYELSRSSESEAAGSRSTR